MARAQPSGTIKPWDLARAYTFSHPLIRSRALEEQVIDESDGAAFRWKLRLYNDSRRTTPLSLNAIARSIVLEWELYGSEGSGVVAHNDLMRLTSFQGPDGTRTDPRKKGIGSTIYAREYDLYRRWGAKEIHLDAIEDGLVVWPKRGFVPQRPGSVAERYDEWAKANRVDGPPPPSLRDYPEDFLRSLEWLPLYKVIE